MKYAFYYQQVKGVGWLGQIVDSGIYAIISFFTQYPAYNDIDDGGWSEINVNDDDWSSERYDRHETIVRRRKVDQWRPNIRLHR